MSRLMPRTQFRVSFLALAVFLVAATSVPGICRAQETASRRVSITAVKVGFAGMYRVGCWTPVWVTFAGGSEAASGHVELIARDADGVPVRYRKTGVTVPAHDEAVVLCYARFGQIKNELTVEFRGQDELLTTRAIPADGLPPAQPTNTELVVSVGGAMGIEEALRLQRGRGEVSAAIPLVTKAADLPDRWWGYEGVDAVCWAGSDRELVAGLSSDQLAALETWVRLGGRLVLSAGANGKELLASGAPFANYNPGRFVEVIEQRRSAELERYASAAQPLLQRDGAPLAVSALADLRFREEAAEGTGAGRYPTIVRFPLGLGKVTLVTFDLDRPPLADWPGRARLVARLLEVPADARETAASERQLGQVTHLGFDDLGGQLHAALEQFSGVPLFSFSWVAAILVVYMLLIGPADYFVLRRLAGRMELTWVTFPCIVLLVCLAAVLLANSWKGHERRLNQIDLVDIDVETGLVRGTSLANLYTPRTEEFDITCQASLPLASEPADALLAWHGLVGKGLGGMDGGQSAALFQRPYLVERGAESDRLPPAGIRGLPVQVSATKSLVARYWTTAELSSTGRLAADADGRLQGDVTNPLEVDLLDGVLFFEESAYKLRSKLAAGERLVLTSQSPVVHIERRLTQRRIVQSGETKAPWDPKSYDIPRILEIMMFHEAAGGRSYTGLTNRQQPQLDLTGHLKAGRAVLLARADSPACRLLQHGAPLAENHTSHHTYYRLVFPVAKRGRGEAAREPR